MTTGKINYHQVNNIILQSIKTLLPIWLPGGKFEGSEYTALNPRRSDKFLGSFKVNCRTGKWSDFATGDKGGDIISLYAYLRNIKQNHAARLLAGGTHGKVSAVKQASEYKPFDKKTCTAPLITRLWTESRPVAGTLAETYLNKRGIFGRIPPSIRFLQSHVHAPSACHYPIMLSAVRVWPDDVVRAVHRTWLCGDSKAPVRPAKMMLGQVSGGSVQLGSPDKILAVCEGIENGLSFMQLYGIPVWAVMSASNYLSLHLPDGIQEIIVAADNDAAGLTAARKAAIRWSEKGITVKVICPPGLGCDFNDFLMARGQCHE